MYLNIGNNTIIRKKAVIGIFDLDKSTVAKKTRDYLSEKEKNGQVIYSGFELPESFIVCVENGEEKVYLSPVSAATLNKRFTENI